MRTARIFYDMLPSGGIAIIMGGEVVFVHKRARTLKRKGISLRIDEAKHVRPTMRRAMLRCSITKGVRKAQKLHGRLIANKN